MRSPTWIAVRCAAAIAVVALTACAGTEPSAPAASEASTARAGSAPTTPAETASDDRFPDVVDADLARDGQRWRLTATVSSPYDSPERYADAFRAVAPDGTVLGVRELLHDHAGEQPFTRSLDRLGIPADVQEVTVEGRDSEHGWGGSTVTVDVPR